MRIRLLFLCIVLSGCSTGKVIPTGPDTYSVTSTGAGFSTDGVRQKVYSSANDFCAAKQLIMVEVDIATRPGVVGMNPPSADLKFRCLEKGDPEIERRTSGIQGVAVGTLRTKSDAVGARDNLARLKQLKELLDSGALTQKEFDQQKAKILAE